MSMCVDVGWIVTDARRAVPHAIDVVAPRGVIRVEVADSARTRAEGLSNRDVVDRGTDCSLSGRRQADIRSGWSICDFRST